MLAEALELERQLAQALAPREVQLSGTAHINGILMIA
jgi:hypothetical protein